MTCSLLSKKQIDIPLLFHWHSAHAALRKKTPNLEACLTYIQRGQSCAYPWCSEVLQSVASSGRVRCGWIPGDRGDFQPVSCPSWLSVVPAEPGSRAQSDDTFFVCLLWPLTAALPVDLQ